MSQVVYCPAAYAFAWTNDDTPMGWYAWDRDEAHSQALRARNAHAKDLKAQGYSPKKFSLRNQQIIRGGVGSGHPQIELVVTCYGINY